MKTAITGMYASLLSALVRIGNRAKRTLEKQQGQKNSPLRNTQSPHDNCDTRSIPMIGDLSYMVRADGTRHK
jgi:hypothetical protein